jgi:hypothetical protein
MVASASEADSSRRLGDAKAEALASDVAELSCLEGTLLLAPSAIDCDGGCNEGVFLRREQRGDLGSKNRR